MGTSLPSTGTLDWEVWCGVGTPLSLWETSTAEISLLIFICHQPIHVSTPPIILHVALLYILNCRTSILLDFKQL